MVSTNRVGIPTVTSCFPPSVVTLAIHRRYSTARERSELCTVMWVDLLYVCIVTVLIGAGDFV